MNNNKKPDSKVQEEKTFYGSVVLTAVAAAVLVIFAFLVFILAAKDSVTLFTVLLFLSPFAVSLFLLAIIAPSVIGISENGVFKNGFARPKKVYKWQEISTIRIIQDRLPIKRIAFYSLNEKVPVAYIYWSQKNQELVERLSKMPVS
jgi:hypothetical protein